MARLRCMQSVRNGMVQGREVVNKEEIGLEEGAPSLFPGLLFSSLGALVCCDCDEEEEDDVDVVAPGADLFFLEVVLVVVVVLLQAPVDEVAIPVLLAKVA